MSIESSAESLTALWERIMHLLRRTSSLIFTSSAMAVRPSTRTQAPILHFHEIMLSEIKQPFPIALSRKIAQFFSLHPFEIFTFGPMMTFGPIQQSEPTDAEQSIRQFPSILVPSGSF